MPINIRVYFSGTAAKLEPEQSGERESITITGLLFKNDPGLASDDLTENSSSLKLGFSGASGLAGTIFGAGVVKRAQSVADTIRSHLRQQAKHTPIEKLILNVFGFSRGGIEALLLAIALKDIPPEQLEINLALLDPVSGNLLWTQQHWRTGIFGQTLTQRVLDLSDCLNIKDVLCLYSQKLGNDHHREDGSRHHITRAVKSFYSAVAPTWPSTCRVEEDVIHGYHDHTQCIHYPVNNPGYVQSNAATIIAYYRCREFLNAHGAGISSSERIFSKTNVMQQYDEMNKKDNTIFNQPYQKTCHSFTGQQVTIHSAKNRFYNRHHFSLSITESTSRHVDPISLSNNFCTLRIVRTNVAPASKAVTTALSSSSVSMTKPPLSAHNITTQPIIHTPA